MDGDISIREIMQGLSWGKYYIFGAIILVGAAGAVYGLLVPRTYKASITLSPVSDSSNRLSGGAGSLLSQYGDIASLVGLSTSGDSKRAESIAVLQSEALTERYVQQNALMPLLFARRWDSVRNIWKPGGDLPTLWKASQYFKKNVRSVSLDAKTGLVTLQISWRDPAFAAKWANGLVDLANSYLREKAIEESQRNIQYLEDQAARTSVVEVKNAIFATLETEIKKEMGARGSAEYALRVVDPAIPPELPSSFGPLLLALGGCVLGFLMAAPTAVAIFIYSRNSSRLRGT